MTTLPDRCSTQLSSHCPAARLRSGHRPAAKHCSSCGLPSLRPGGQITLLLRTQNQSHRQSRRNSVDVKALDAAMPFDFEARAQERMAKAKQLTIGIVGFGTFGQFLAKRLVQGGHKVMATSRADYSSQAASIGAQYYRDPDDFCEEHPDVVILATSITSIESVLRSLPLQRLKRSTLFVDVLSVKEFPKRLLLDVLPSEFDILCTHPMFGPDSGRGSWAGLKFMYDKVRIGSGERRQRRVDSFLEFFKSQGCDMEEMECAAHDELASRTQFITHTIGRVLGAMDLQPTRIDTRGFRSLLDLVDNTAHDSFDLYYGLFMYNQNATEELARLEQSFDYVKKQLFDRMHNTVRRQLFNTGAKAAAMAKLQQQQAALLAGSSSIPSNGATKALPELSQASTAANGNGSSVDSSVDEADDEAQQSNGRSNGLSSRL